MNNIHKNGLREITIRGFKSIRCLDNLKLNNLNVLVGHNGVGKSNFISYFSMLRSIFERRFQVFAQRLGGAERLLTFGANETNEIFSRFLLSDKHYEFAIEYIPDNGFVFAPEAIFHGEQGAQYIADSISCIRIYHFNDTSNTAGVRRFCTLDDNTYLRSDASNLAAFLYWIKSEYLEVYDQIRKVVALAMPFFDDFVLEPQTIRGDDQQIRLMWKQKNSDYLLSPAQLSDGSIRFICLVTALLQPRFSTTIIIDEPELGLHPYAITLLGALIRSTSIKMQVIIATQSAQFINEFSINDLIVVERKDNVSVFKHLDENEFKEWLDDYTIGELLEKNILY